MADEWDDDPNFRYRFFETHTSNNGVMQVTLSLDRFPVIRKTPAGAFIEVMSQQKFVLDGQGKRYAHEKVEWARTSWYARKKWQGRYAANTLDRIMHAKLMMAEGKITRLNNGYMRMEDL